MSYHLSKGDICYAAFPFEENAGLTKRRTVLVWDVSADKKNVTASKITGIARGWEWEVPLFPSSQNGLVKNCVIRVDQTRVLPISSFSPPIGSLSQYELNAAEDCLKKYLKLH